jgi:hypothetical protein
VNRILTAELLGLFLAIAAKQEETLENLVDRWKQDSPALRDSGSKEIVRLWKGWKDSDLEALAALEKGTDREAAGRAADALRAIRFRRDFGESLYPKIEKADALLEEHRTSGRSATIIAWAMPGGPMFDLSAPVNQLIEMGPQIEPFLRPRLSDPALRNEVAIILSYLGSAESLPALVEQLPWK